MVNVLRLSGAGTPPHLLPYQDTVLPTEIVLLPVASPLPCILLLMVKPPSVMLLSSKNMHTSSSIVFGNTVFSFANGSPDFL